MPAVEAEDAERQNSQGNETTTGIPFSSVTAAPWTIHQGCRRSSEGNAEVY
jgi:hypothetical protein